MRGERIFSDGWVQKKNNEYLLSWRLIFKEEGGGGSRLPEDLEENFKKILSF